MEDSYIPVLADFRHDPVRTTKNRIIRIIMYYQINLLISWYIKIMVLFTTVHNYYNVATAWGIITVYIKHTRSTSPDVDCYSMMDRCQKTSSTNPMYSS